MYSQTLTLGNGANGFKDVLTLRSPRLGMHHHIRGNNFADAFLDGVAKHVHLFKACRTRHTYGCIHKMSAARAPDAHTVHIKNAFHAPYGPSDLLLQALRRYI